MKRLVVVSLILSIAAAVSPAQSSRGPLGVTTGSLSISGSGSLFSPVTGDYDASTKITDPLEAGPALGISVGYSISPLLTLRGSYDFAYNEFDAQYRPDGKTPAFVAPMITADVVLKFGSLISKQGQFNPYCFTGTGLSLWKFTQDGTCGKGRGIPAVSPTGSEWKDSSFELHTGLGAEAYIASNFSLFAEGQFRYFFSKNTAEFGKDFGNLLFIKVSGGVTYYFDLGGEGK